MARIQFAWVDGSETTFGPEHMREDEHIESLNVEHEEGAFASLTIVIKNPRIGFLHASRKQWAWLSIGSTPLFFGRLLSLPTSINKEAVTLEFQARPANFQEQKETLAATMRTLPFYDPVWITPEAQIEADTVLEAKPELWHIDRVTGDVTTSHILTGEDGLANFDPIEIPYDSVDINIGQVPARTLVVNADVSWTQGAIGFIDMGQYQIRTFTGKSLLSQWPKRDQTLDGGWFIANASVRDNFNVEAQEVKSSSASWSNQESKHSPGDTMSFSVSQTRPSPTVRGVEIQLSLATKEGGHEASIDATSVIYPEWSITSSLVLGYKATRERKEAISFTMSANFQDLITLPGEEDVEILSISGGDVGILTPVPGGQYGETEIPIGDRRGRSYFTTERGTSSLEWLILRARSQLMLASRAVEVTCTIPWARAIELSCRKNGRINDRRLPGGVATGKIIKYGFSSDGNAAQRIGTVTIACSIGYGGSVDAVPGDPDYVDDDYVQPDYQYHTNQIVVLDASDVGYAPPVFDPGVDDGLHFPLSRTQGILDCSIVGDIATQRAAINLAAVMPSLVGLGGPNLINALVAIAERGERVPKQVDDALKTHAHYLSLRLVNLEGGPFQSVYNVALTDLEIPQGIDLMAASS